MGTVYGAYAGSGNYWRTYLTTNVSNKDNATASVSYVVGINHKAIPSDVASSWNKKYDSGYVKIKDVTDTDWSTDDFSGTESVATSGSFRLKSGSMYITRDCSALTVSASGRNTHNGTAIKLSGTSTASTSNISISARPKYTITFDRNGGGGGSVSLKCAHCQGNHKSYGYNSSIVTLTPPIRTGYEFNGWYTARTGGTEVTTVTVNLATTYYAHWTANPYTVHYNANPPSGETATGFTLNSSHVYGTSKALTANGFSVAGYDFIGWATSATGAKIYNDQQRVINLTATSNATVQLYAKWKPRIPNTYVKNNRWFKVNKVCIKVNSNWVYAKGLYIKQNGSWFELE